MRRSLPNIFSFYLRPPAYIHNFIECVGEESCFFDFVESFVAVGSECDESMLVVSYVGAEVTVEGCDEGLSLVEEAA